MKADGTKSAREIAKERDGVYAEMLEAKAVARRRKARIHQLETKLGVTSRALTAYRKAYDSVGRLTDPEAADELLKIAANVSDLQEWKSLIQKAGERK